METKIVELSLGRTRQKSWKVYEHLLLLPSLFRSFVSRFWRNGVVVRWVNCHMFTKLSLGSTQGSPLVKVRVVTNVYLQYKGREESVTSRFDKINVLRGSSQSIWKTLVSSNISTCRPLPTPCPDSSTTRSHTY